MTTLLLVLLAGNAAALVGLALLYRKTRKAQRLRRVEAPNSQYKSPYVQDLEARERWESIELERLHEVNREEVVKVLTKLHATSVRALTPSERAFLDRIVEAQDRVTQRGKGKGGPRGGSSVQPRHLPGTS